MLPRNWRVIVLNGTAAASVAVTVRVRRKKIAPDLSITYDADTLVFSAGAIPGGTYNTAGAIPQDNSGAASWQSMDWMITVDNGTSAGDYSVFIQASNDSGATWPNNGESELLDVINVAASTTERRSGSY